MADTIPRAPNTGRYLAETNDGRLLYLNHADEWQEMPNILAIATPAPTSGGEAVAWLREESTTLLEMYRSGDANELRLLAETLVRMLAQPAPEPAGGVRGPWRAEFGALLHEDLGGFVFTVSPASFADDVAKGLNALAALSPATAASDGAGKHPAPATVEMLSKAERDGYQSKLHWLRAYRAKTGAPLKQAMAAYDRDEPFGPAALAPATGRGGTNGTGDS